MAVVVWDTVVPSYVIAPESAAECPADGESPWSCRRRCGRKAIHAPRRYRSGPRARAAAKAMVECARVKDQMHTPNGRRFAEELQYALHRFDQSSRSSSTPADTHSSGGSRNAVRICASSVRASAGLVSRSASPTRRTSSAADEPVVVDCATTMHVPARATTRSERRHSLPEDCVAPGLAARSPLRPLDPPRHRPHRTVTPSRECPARARRARPHHQRCPVPVRGFRIAHDHSEQDRDKRLRKHRPTSTREHP